MKRQLGFALLELIVVFVIVSIFITLSTPSYKQASTKLQELKELTAELTRDASIYAPRTQAQHHS